MNKNSMIAIGAIVGVILIGGIGYAIWQSSNSPATPQTTVSNTDTTTNPTQTQNQNPAPAPQPGVPTVKTDSSTVSYVSTVVVKGTVNPNGAATTYWYEYGQTTGLGTQTSSYSIGSGYADIYTPAYITGLGANTNYYFRLNAKNAFGTVTGATYSFTTNNTPVITGIAPTTTTNTATDVSRTTANLHGKINSNGFETTFWFEYGLTSELGTITAFQSAGGGSSTSPVSISVSNLQPLTKYFFRLNAQNQFGTINGQILNFTTQGPAAPSVPTASTKSATAITNSSVRLNANITPNGAATTYWFEYSADATLSSNLSSTPQVLLGDSTATTNVSVSVSSLTSDTKYYFRIVTTNQYGTTRGDIKYFTTARSIAVPSVNPAPGSN